MVQNSHRADYRLLCWQSGQQADIHLPVKAQWLHDGRHRLSHHGKVGLFRIRAVVGLGCGEEFERPDNYRGGEYDGRNLLQVVGDPFPNVQAGVPPGRHAERRQNGHIVLVNHSEPTGMLHHKGEKYGQQYAYGIKRDHHERPVIWEKR